MILLTRPYDDSAAMAKILGKENCIIEPMLEIEELEYDSQILKEKIQAIVTTSKNAKLPALDCKKISIPQNGTNAEEILQFCRDNLKPNAGKVLYFSGNIVSLDIAKELSHMGFDAERVVCYRQIAHKILSENFNKNFAKITVSTFFSRQTLQNFMRAVDVSKLSKIKCVCISQKVAELAETANWKHIFVSATPDQQGMIAAIRQC